MCLVVTRPYAIVGKAINPCLQDYNPVKNKGIKHLVYVYDKIYISARTAHMYHIIEL